MEGLHVVSETGLHRLFQAALTDRGISSTVMLSLSVRRSRYESSAAAIRSNNGVEETRSCCLRELEGAFEVERGAGLEDFGAGAEAASGGQARSERVMNSASELLFVGSVCGDIDERSHRGGYAISRAFTDIPGRKFVEVQCYATVAHGEPRRNRQMDKP